jgi:hypothetical protein
LPGGSRDWGCDGEAGQSGLEVLTGGVDPIDRYTNPPEDIAAGYIEAL